MSEDELHVKLIFKTEQAWNEGFYFVFGYVLVNSRRIFFVETTEELLRNHTQFSTNSVTVKYVYKCMCFLWITIHGSVTYSFHWFLSSMALQPLWTLAASVSRTPWPGDRQVAEQHKLRIKHIDIHASSGIRTHDPSVRAGEDCSCLRPRGHYDRQFYWLSGLFEHPRKFISHHPWIIRSLLYLGIWVVICLIGYANILLWERLQVVLKSFPSVSYQYAFECILPLIQVALHKPSVLW
jgi:hypothetical protein